jgi:hypothetical protein
MHGRTAREDEYRKMDQDRNTHAQRIAREDEYRKMEQDRNTHAQRIAREDTNVER